MKSIASFMVVICLCFVYTCDSKLLAQEQPSGLKGIDFFHGTFKEALAKAEKEGKLVFMDAYTTWCGPCRRMSSNVFPDDAVGEFYNANFINLKVDMEKGEGPELSKKYGVRSYPTFLYLGSDGKVVHSDGGARPAEPFIELGRAALKKFDRSGDWAKLYEAGNREPATVLAYIKSLNQVGKPSLRIANEYLSAQTDLSKSENLEIILEATTEADSRIFDFLVQNKKAIVELKSLEIYESKIYQACKRTVRKALDYRNESLLEEAQEKMKNIPSRYDEFKATTGLDYYGETGNVEKFNTAAKAYADKVAKKDPAKLKDLGQRCIKYFKDDKNTMSLAEKTAKQAYSLSKDQTYCIHYGRMLYHNGKKSDAISLVKKGVELAKSKNEPTQMLDYLLRDWGVEI
ncbi:MAG: DUF255 domain-containing protein [Saprospiraceae bacterium]|nr:DUF255 domain-containing protein [Saprospiraceae bacterium]